MNVDPGPGKICQQLLFFDLRQFHGRVYLADAVVGVEAAEVTVFEHVGHQQDDPLVHAFGIFDVIADGLQAEQDFAARNVRAGFAHCVGKSLSEPLVQRSRLTLQAGIELSAGHHRYVAEYGRIDRLFKLAGELQTGVVTFQVGAERVKPQLVTGLDEALDVAPGGFLQVRRQWRCLIDNDGQQAAGRCTAKVLDFRLGVAARDIIALRCHEGSGGKCQSQDQALELH